MHMAAYTGVFKRVEKKYLLDDAQYAALRARLSGRMRVDRYGRTTICNIYFDTPTRLLVRNSIERPVYKEKLRLRTYGVPDADSPAFVELKKKFQGTVYKRRVTMPYAEAMDWLCRGAPPRGDSQITREIEWFLQFYGNLEPAAALFYDRVALYGVEDSALRITFDEAIRWRGYDMALTGGDGGDRLLEDGAHLMEIKIAGGMPLWLSEALSALEIYPTSYSKYGTAYLSAIAQHIK